MPHLFQLATCIRPYRVFITLVMTLVCNQFSYIQKIFASLQLASNGKKIRLFDVDFEEGDDDD